jgi:PAS domain S-box-containing protein
VKNPLLFTIHFSPFILQGVYMTKKNQFEANVPKLLRVLMIEDSEDDVFLIIRNLKKGGYNPVYERVETAAAMKQSLHEKQWDIILCDYKMPKFDAPSAIALLKETNINIPLIIISGTIGEETAVECMRLGAHDYLMKANLSRLCSAIARELEESEGRNKQKQAEFQREAALEALRQSEQKYRILFDEMISGYAVHEIICDQTGNPFDYRFLSVNKAFEKMTGLNSTDIIGRAILEVLPDTEPIWIERYGQVALTRKPAQFENYSSMLGKYFEVRAFSPEQGKFATIFNDITERRRAEEELILTLESLRKAFGATIQVLVSAVEVRDPYTAGHQIRSADLARAIAIEMGLPKAIVDGIRMAGSIHDIGKLSVPAEILSKPTKLTNTEFSLIKEHPLKGYEILKNVESPWPLAQIVYQHHERMDGSGYPRKLKGNEIILEARIMAVADVVEAMASHRPYRPALGIEAANGEIEKNKGFLYDSDVADACLRLFRENNYTFAS